MREPEPSPSVSVEGPQILGPMNRGNQELYLSTTSYVLSQTYLDRHCPIADPENPKHYTCKLPELTPCQIEPPSMIADRSRLPTYVL